MIFDLQPIAFNNDTFAQIKYNNKVLEMYDSNYPSNKKRGSFNDDTTYLPTAQKSQYRDYPQAFLEKTPTKLQYFSPSKRSDRLSQARKSINEAIELVSSKKNMNKEAIEEVKNVNNEIATSLSSYNATKNSQYQHKNKTTTHYRDDSSREFVATSQFQWHAPEDLNKSQKESILSHQNVDLRSKLNEEIRKNNELIRHIKLLQNQNSTLKKSQQNNTQISSNSILEENRYLRNQLSTSQNYQSVPSDILEQLRRLKEQNQVLRRDTISLLKGKGHY